MRDLPTPLCRSARHGPEVMVAARRGVVLMHWTHREGAAVPAQGPQPVVELITERVAAGYASSGTLFALDSPAATTQHSTPQLSLFLKSFLQPVRRGGGGQPVVLRAARRLGPGHDSALVQRDGGGWATSSVSGGMSLYQLRSGKPQSQQQPLFSPGHLLGPTLRASDSFDVDVDIELLPVDSGFLSPLEAARWLALPLAHAAAKAHAVLRGGSRRAVSFHAAVRAWSCAHRHMLLGLLVTQLGLTTLIFLAVHLCPAPTQQRAVGHSLVVSAATEAHAQLREPLLLEERDMDAVNPLHSLVVMVRTP